MGEGTNTGARRFGIDGREEKDQDALGLSFLFFFLLF